MQTDHKYFQQDNSKTRHDERLILSETVQRIMMSSSLKT